MAERNAAVGYAALGKQTTTTAAVIPSLYVPYYSQSIDTDFNTMSDEPVYGNRFKRIQTLKGTRKHGGTITVMAEPNTAAYWMDMLASKSSTSGANPYTHTFGASNTVDPNAYTLDVSVASQVIRFVGVQASKLSLGWNNDKMEITADVAGLKSNYGREIATVATTTITLKTDYDPTPNDTFVVGDLVKLTKIDGGVTLNTTIATVNADGITLTLGASAATLAAGDMIVLRPATPSYTLLTPFLWGNTRFFFAADAATNLTNSATVANQVRLDHGTQIDLMNEFVNADGEKRSGGFDPAALIRARYDATCKIKKYFDNPDDFKYWNALTKRAVLMRCYSGSTLQYELRVILNNTTVTKDNVDTASGNAIMHDIELSPNYDLTDGQGFNTVVIDAVATV